ncbi:hypothetical protein [Burkholderia ambifaria]|uniref:Uncharacterized protein n=1 Tax=Burkholderia ambifaria MEX-5 TaxID=396597 RepID=B1T1Z4_9BURK|nr:hypothetical protein [Burkholderia ambifaria]EDT42413.1 hypothetical protein BamMEX5DRAFT_1810 [Burkholderia ambifaria MEX-5]
MKKIINSMLFMGCMVVLSGATVAAADSDRSGHMTDPLENMPVVLPMNDGGGAILEALPGRRVMLEVPDESHIFVLDASLIKYRNLLHYKNMVTKSLRNNGTVVLKGERDSLLALKPDWLKVWPDSNTIILTSRMGTSVDGVRDRGVRDARHIVEAIERHVRLAKRRESSILMLTNDVIESRNKRSGATGDATKEVAFSLHPSSPVETCTGFGNGLVKQGFSRPLTKEERRVLSDEVSRWCQSGTLSNYQAAIATSAVPRWLYTEQPKLNLMTEWALIRSEDKVVPENSKYFFWVKTVGQGSGTGFTRSLHDTATFRNNVMYGLLDATIYSGWGNSYPYRENSWSYPVGTDDWSSAEPALFGCNFGDRGSVCPSGASVVHLFPSDTFNNSVSVAKSTAFSINGTFGIKGLSNEGAAGGPVKGFNATLSISRTESTQKSATVNLTNVQTSPGLPFSRSTRWRPDVPAIWDYLISRGVTGDFGSATPTAATINPEYDVLWKIPMRSNQGKEMKFSMIYEAGWNNCVRELCANMSLPTDPSVAPQKRVFWIDSVLVDLRVRSANDV